MSTTLVALSDVPTITGNATGLSSASTELQSLASQATSAGASVKAAWGGLTDANYNTPEAPAVKQAVTAVDKPLVDLTTGLKSVSAALEELSVTLAGLQQSASQLSADISAFLQQVALYHPVREPGFVGPVAGPVLVDPRTKSPGYATEWYNGPGMQAQNDALLARASKLKADIDAAEAAFVSQVGAIVVPEANLKAPAFTPGAKAGNYSTSASAGPGYTGTVYASSGYQDGSYHAGVGLNWSAYLYKGYVETSTDYGLATGTYGASVEVGNSGNADATVAVGAEGAHLDLAVQAQTEVTAKADAKVDAFGIVTGTGSVSAEAGASAGASGHVDVGLDGAQVGVSADAFIGGKAGVDIGVEAGGVTAKGGFDVRAGYGVELDADVSISADKVGFSFDLGVAFGIGGGVSFDVSFSPKEVVKDIAKAATDFWDWLF